MKKLILCSLALFVTACASTQPQDLSDRVTPPAVAEEPSNQVEAEAAAPPVPSEPTERWTDLSETERYLLIMGTADGFSAAGAGAPCFPGKDNTALDDQLQAAGFGSMDPTTLPGALADLSAAAEECNSAPQRGYDTSLLKSMPDEHLATYLTGAVQGYASIRACDISNHSYAAATATAAIFSTPSASAPASVLSEALAEGCLGVPKEPR